MPQEPSEIAKSYLAEHPALASLEILTPDMNGILRAKRIPRSEMATFFAKGLTGPGTTPIMNTLGDCCELEGLSALHLGTNLRQQGTQYCNPEDMAEFDDFLESVRLACVEQGIPATTAHLEYAPAQFEINLHHVDDVVAACDHAVLLKRLIKGVAGQKGMGATFMAKPFAEHPGSGLHIHISVYDADGNNIFADRNSEANPPISMEMRNAIGGLGELMAESQAIFAPNANSYRRLQPGLFVPLSPNWGYNHRDVSLRIPVSDPSNLRIEHRVAGADANQYLVMACILAGIHHGLSRRKVRYIIHPSAAGRIPSVSDIGEQRRLRMVSAFGVMGGRVQGHFVNAR